MGKFFLFLLFILLISSASAACLEISASKTSFFSGETFLAEISGNPVYMKPENIFFYSGSQEIQLLYNLVQAAGNKWFVYANVPSNPGQYSFSVQTLCIENSSLKEFK